MTETEEIPETNLVVKLISLDGGEFEIPIKAAYGSQLIKDALPENIEEVSEVDPVDVLRVGAKCLAKVVDFLNHNFEEPLNEIPCPLAPNHTSFEEVVTQSWYQEFCSDENMPQEILFEVMRASNYMTIPPLLDLACLKVTFQLHGKTAEQIREMLNLPELTPEEEATAREEHRWIFENS